MRENEREGERIGGKRGMKVLKKYNQKTVRQSDHERMKKLVKMP